MGYNGGGFHPLWDTTEDVFLHCGIKRRRLSSVVGYYRRGFFSLWGGARYNIRIFYKFSSVVSVPDRRSRDHEVVVVRRTINLGTGNLEWGGNGEGLRKGRSFYQ